MWRSWFIISVMLKNESFKANSNSMEGSVLNALYGGAFVCFSKFITFEFIKKSLCILFHRRRENFRQSLLIHAFVSISFFLRPSRNKKRWALKLWHNKTNGVGECLWFERFLMLKGGSPEKRTIKYSSWYPLVDSHVKVYVPQIERKLIEVNISWGLFRKPDIRNRLELPQISISGNGTNC